MNKNSQLLVDIGQGLSIAVGLPTIALWSQDSRPKNAKRGTIGFNIDTNSIEFFDGQVWFHSNMNKV